jgi:hypothetical protein
MLVVVSTTCGFAAARSLAGTGSVPNGARVVAVNPPKGGAPTCSGAPVRVGASLPTDPSEPLQTVSDVYSVWGGPEGAVEIAWFYFANDGKTIFLQYNYASIATYGAHALGITLDSVATPGGFGAIVPWNHQPVARRYRVVKCAAPSSFG